jgi:hypothetical protein
MEPVIKYGLELTDGDSPVLKSTAFSESRGSSGGDVLLNFEHQVSTGTDGLLVALNANIDDIGQCSVLVADDDWDERNMNDI